MRAFVLIFFLNVFTANSFSQELNFDEISPFNNIKEIKHFEILHSSKSSDTRLLNYYFYNSDGNIIEKRYNYRTTQKKRKNLGEKRDRFIYTDTVGTKENPAFTTINYKYNKKGNLIYKSYRNTEPVFLINGFYTENPIISECKNYNKEGLHTSSEITYAIGNFETHYYTYDKNLILNKKIYRNEKLYKSVFFVYIFY